EALLRTAMQLLSVLLAESMWLRTGCVEMFALPVPSVALVSFERVSTQVDHLDASLIAFRPPTCPPSPSTRKCPPLLSEGSLILSTTSSALFTASDRPVQLPLFPGLFGEGAVGPSPVPLRKSSLFLMLRMLAVATLSAPTPGA